MNQRFDPAVCFGERQMRPMSARSIGARSFLRMTSRRLWPSSIAQLEALQSFKTSMATTIELNKLFIRLSHTNRTISPIIPVNSTFSSSSFRSSPISRACSRSVTEKRLCSFRGLANDTSSPRSSASVNRPAAVAGRLAVGVGRPQTFLPIRQVRRNCRSTRPIGSCARAAIR